MGGYDVFLQNIQCVWLCTAQSPDYSQNMRIFLVVSLDNSQTWSNPIDVATTDFANRGFASMALDKVKGHLVFGWYDERNDKSYKSLEYFGAVLSAKKLDKLVKGIPLSNPLFIDSPPTTPPKFAKRKRRGCEKIEILTI